MTVFSRYRKNAHPVGQKTTKQAMVLACASVFLALSWSQTAKADGPGFGLPIACTIGEDCWITSHVDMDPSSRQHEDWACGPVAYDTHKGTDFGVGTMSQAVGVDVLAAAAGTVLRTRDGMLDVNSRLAENSGRDINNCGNGVVIDHGHGWETQYCHLREGSVSVRSGDRVNRGDVIGEVGLSGKTEHPHVHFSIRKDDRVMDPFVGRQARLGCGADTRDSLWLPDVLITLLAQYDGGLIYNLGFADETPNRLTARDGQFEHEPLKPSSSKLIFWTDLIGIEQGDQVTMTVELESETIKKHVVVSRDVPFEEKGWVQWFGFTGQRIAEDKQLPKGVYTGTVSLSRPGKGVITERHVSTVVE
ncbi:MAG: M23 family metallopeptidase [Rhodospirillaceae bacterium]